MSINRGRNLQDLNRSGQGGITLIELIVFIVIVGVALGGVLTVLNMTTAHSADPMIRKQMLAIAEALLDEVEMRPFTVCQPDDANAGKATTTAECASKVQWLGQPSGASDDRSQFNNVGNYCKAGTSGASCEALVLGSDTTAFYDLTKLNPSPPGYWATIELKADSASPLGPIGMTISSDASNASGMNFLRIVVTVHHSGTSESIVLEGYRTRWAPSL